jgi:YVTN family beta-propeller protein
MSEFDRRLGDALKRVRDQGITTAPGRREEVFRRGKRRRLMKFSAALIGGVALAVLAGSVLPARFESREVAPASSDPAAVTATIELGSSGIMRSIVANDDGVWVPSYHLMGDDERGSMSRIDPVTNEVTHGPPVLSAHGVHDLALGPDGIWAVSWQGDIGEGGTANSELQLVDPESMKVLANPFFGGDEDAALYAVTVDPGGTVWTVNAAAGQLLRIKPQDNNVKEIPTGNFPVAVAATQEGVWVSNSKSGTITEVDADAGGALRDISLDCPGDLMAAFGSLWVVDYCHDQVQRIDTDGLQIENIPTGDGPAALAQSHGQIWVVNSLDDSVTRIDPNTNEPIGAAITVGTSPSGIATGAGAVWVVNEGDGTVSRIDYGHQLDRVAPSSPTPERAEPSPSPPTSETGEADAPCRHRSERIEAHGAYGTMVSEALTPTAEIAAGVHDGGAWSLCAYRAELTRNQEPTLDSLCEEFRFGPPPHSGYTCSSSMGTDAPPNSDYFHRAAVDLDPSSVGRGFYGAISDEVHRVLLALPNGDEIEATIYEPPPELGLNYRFFVGFAPTKKVVVTVESKTGNRLEIERWSAED